MMDHIIFVHDGYRPIRNCSSKNTHDIDYICKHIIPIYRKRLESRELKWTDYEEFTKNFPDNAFRAKFNNARLEEPDIFEWYTEEGLNDLKDHYCDYVDKLREIGVYIIKSALVI